MRGQGLLLGALLVLIVGCICTNSIDSIVSENALPGTTQWWQKQTNYTPVAQGFSTKFSYVAGETVEFKISSDIGTSYYMGIYRLGFYNGTGGRFQFNLSVSNTRQPKCYFELSSLMTDCSNWHVSAEWKIPADAYTGIYVALPVHRNEHTNIISYGSYIPFIVRQPVGKVKSDILFKTADLTWVAYNKYGNWNLYRGNHSYSPDSRAFKASYNRPWQNRHRSPNSRYNNFLFSAEFAMVFWLEKQGYDVSYASCSDVEDMHSTSVLVPRSATTNVTTASPFKVMLSVGHDEYWTPALKTAYEAARDNGVSLAFFSGNEVFWRVLWDEETHAARHTSRYTSVQNRNNFGDKKRKAKDLISKATMYDMHSQQVVVLDHRRVMVCRKETINNVSSVTKEDWTGTFRDPRHRVPEDESLLSGQWFMVNAHRRDAMQVTRDDASLRFWRDASFAHVGSAQVARKRDTPASEENDTVNQKLRTMPNISAHDVVHTTPRGVLGYEWDVFPVHARPMGLIPLSTTHISLHKYLVQDYGARYKGSGQATHRLSLYRHYRRTAGATLTGSFVPGSFDIPKDLHRQVCHKTNPLPARFVPTPALVFGAGTVQWSWALSAWHDGPSMQEDRDLQQATLNVLADMGVYPHTLSSPARVKARSTTDLPLVMPSQTSETVPPKSSILHVAMRRTPKQSRPSHAGLHHSAAFSATQRISHVGHILQLEGHAEDLGGGVVAAVEVSVDAGQTWHPATGRSRWHYTHHFIDEVSPIIDVYTSARSSDGDVLSKYRDIAMHSAALYEQGSSYANTSMIVISRAIDDSGWIEDTHLETLNALCLFGSRKTRDFAAVDSDSVNYIRESTRVSSNVFILDFL